MPKLQIACNTRVTDGHGGAHEERAGQEVRAGRARVPAHQPPDRLSDLRPGGRVQAAGLLHGLRPAGEPRSAVEDKVHKAKAIDIGPHVMLDQERCILCSRCIRFLDEVTKTGELGVLRARRPLRASTLAPGKTPRQPVLRQRRRHLSGRRAHQPGLPLPRARLVPRAHAESVCTGCATGCNIDIHHREGRIFRFRPRYNPDVNQYWMCDEGRMTPTSATGRGPAAAAARARGRTRSPCAAGRRRSPVIGGSAAEPVARAGPRRGRHRRVRAGANEEVFLLRSLASRLGGDAGRPVVVAARRRSRRLPDRRGQEPEHAGPRAPGGAARRRGRRARWPPRQRGRSRRWCSAAPT